MVKVVYIIKWRDKRTRGTGEGIHMFDRVTALEICNRMNEEYPYIDHWIEEKGHGGKNAPI